MPKRVKTLFVGAKMDLNDGPFSKADMKAYGISPWPGYHAALEKIREWADSNIGDVWYDTQSGHISDSEPQGFHDGDEWIDPVLEDYVHFDREDVMREVFGSLVTDGGL